MRILEHFNQRFASRELTPGIRFTALVLAVINLPLTIPGAIYLVFGLPGFILWGYYWGIAYDKVKARPSLWVWYGTIVYNLLLFVGFLSLHYSHSSSYNLMEIVMIAGQAGTAGIAANMARITHEKIAQDQQTSQAV